MSAFLRFLRRLLRHWLEKADRDTLNAINSELGQWRKQISEKLKN